MTSMALVKQKSLLLWGLVIASLVATALSWSSSQSLGNMLFDSAIFAAILLISEILFVAGGVLALSAVGQKVLGGVGLKPWLWFRQIAQVKRMTKVLFREIGSSRLVWWGFVMNFLGATATGLVFLIGPLLILPSVGRGLALLGVLDLAATFARCWPCYLALKSSVSAPEINQSKAAGSIA